MCKEDSNRDDSEFKRETIVAVLKGTFHKLIKVIFLCFYNSVNRPLSIDQFSNMAPRLSGAMVGFEPTTSGLDLPMLYRLNYEVSTGAGRGNLGSESRLMYK